ncbi:L domain-like protein [Westerdykella ornata]|uniref:L domain-like protein n=1 Tax=Westerdykella ornata TaxID=318751 RepID=A0A6A6JWW0_WESOR|nr:L domain-like protein [Westerdykella ornata]KAF2280226.1 L domain-like protein [Westerdykella ornata]
MERPQSSIPVRSSGIPRPASRLPVPKPAGAKSQLRSTSSTEQLRKKPSLNSIGRPTPTSSTSTLQKKPSRTSLARPTSSSTTGAAGVGSIPTSTVTRNGPSDTQVRAPTKPASERPHGRNVPPSSRHASHSSSITQSTEKDGDGLGDLDVLQEDAVGAGLARGDNPSTPISKRPPPSLADRTMESLAFVQTSSPAGKSRRTSTFFATDKSMPPPRRPAGSIAEGQRPRSSDGTPRGPLTPRRTAAIGPGGAMTTPGKRSVSETTPTTTPGRTPSMVRQLSQIRRNPNSQSPSIISVSKTKTLKSKPSLDGTFGAAISPPGTAVTVSPSPRRANGAPIGSPDNVRSVSNSSAAFREQIAKAKAARLAKPSSEHTAEASKKTSNSSAALREQITKAKEAARRAHTANRIGRTTPLKEVPAVTQNDFGIEPDPAEIAEFDFGLEDPFNQRSKGSKSLLRKRIDAARVGGKLNIAAMGLKEIPDEVLTMYKYDPNDDSVAWGEAVDLITIIAADNELATLPDRMFPDVDMDLEALMDSDEDGPQFGGVQSLDFHGNHLLQLPSGLRRLTQLTKLNLSRNQLPIATFELITQIITLRELKLADNVLQGALPASLGALTQLEVLELQGNKITSLPAEIGELVHLRTLNVANNDLRELPSELFTSVPLIELMASKNALSGALFTVESIPTLQHLHLAHNSISSLCSGETLDLPALKTLDLSANRLTALPDMTPWTSLDQLLVGENKLEALPTGFVTLKHLRTADFTANNIHKLDEQVALMDRLESLTLAANPLCERKFLTMNTEDLKRDLLSRLEVDVTNTAESECVAVDDPPPNNGWVLRPSGILDLSFQNLTDIDEQMLIEFAKANDIRQISLQQNYFQFIPAVFSQLDHLSVLDLSKNNIEEPFQKSIEFPKLRELRLTGNKMQSLESMTTYLSAPLLQHLDVSNNHISGALPSLVTSFPGLTVLLASNNAITEVQADSLKGLKIANLSNNEISRLDPEIGLLSGSLTSFEVEGNTFRVPNYAVLRKGTEAVLAWLRDKIPAPVEASEGVDTEEF